MQTEEKRWDILKKKTERYERRWNMAEDGSHIIAGISGGADSVCLLFVLLEWKRTRNIHITAVHVNHMLRGEEALRDERFVEELCKKHGVPCRVFRIDVAEEARMRKCSEEEAGRDIRRACMEQVLRESHGDRIAFAHHQDDNAETVIMNLIRGTGVKGMRGIRPCSGIYIRPLLGLRRREIEDALKEMGQDWCDDATNHQDIYTRNRIRNRVMRELEDINPKAVGHIAQLSDKISELWEYMEAETAKYKKRCFVKDEDGWILKKEEFLDVPDPFRKEIAKSILAQICGKEKDISAVHVENLLGLMEKQPGKEVDFPCDTCAEKTYEGIRFRKGERKKEDNSGLFIRIRVFPRENGEKNWPDTPYTKWFDYDIIKSRPVLRNRRPGDYILIDRQGNRQKIKKFFINEKIPKEKRESIPLVADGDEIMWIVGYRQSKAYQITDKTTTIMEIEIYGGE